MKCKQAAFDLIYLYFETDSAVDDVEQRMEIPFKIHLEIYLYWSFKSMPSTLMMNELFLFFPFVDGFCKIILLRQSGQILGCVESSPWKALGDATKIIKNNILLSRFAVIHEKATKRKSLLCQKL